MEKKIITGNEPALPHGAWGQQTGTGLTIRQHFAAMAMQGLMACTAVGKAKEFAKSSIEMADALIIELNK